MFKWVHSLFRSRPDFARTALAELLKEHPQASLDTITKQGDVVYASLKIPPDAAAAFEPLRLEATKRLVALPGISQAHVTLTAERQADTPPQTTHRRPPPKPKQMLEGVKYVIAVASGKGGVGKSTFAAHLARGLTELGWHIGLLDADVYGPSVPKLFNITGFPEVQERRIIPHEKEGIKLMSMGLMVEENAAVMWRGPMVTSALQQMLFDVNWAPLDCLIIDLPPGTGDIHLSLVQSLVLSGAIVISTPQDLALSDARRGITMFQKVDVPVLGLVENMSLFVCPHCAQSTPIFAHGHVHQEAKKLGIPFLGDIPLSPTLRAAADAGESVLLREPAGPSAQMLRHIAQQVKDGLMRDSVPHEV